ncbi:MAG: SH3 domain-containing protein [Clostridiales bacterium]|nr:SH3 domain-containing protein [Clostridiales bacterium]
MRTNDRAIGMGAWTLRAAVSLTLVICLLFSMLPTAFAGTSVGGSSSNVSSSSTKTYIKLSKNVTFFTGEVYNTGSTVAAASGQVFQLVSDDYYTNTSDKKEYYSVYYLSKRYNVLKTDVLGDLMTDAEVVDYITNTVWKQSIFVTLRAADNVIGDIRAHAVQHALNKLGYTVVADGNYGDKTAEAVKLFQRANSLDRDGSAGPLTQTVLFSLASGNTITGGGTTGGGSSTGGSTASETGTVKTTSSVNLRKSSSTTSSRLAVVPKGVKFTYTNTRVRNGVTWYYVIYNGYKGWLMGTFLSASSSSSSGGSSGSGSSSTTAIGTVTITLPSTRVRKTPNGSKSGTVLAKGTVVDLLAQPTTAGGYSWYKIRTGSGLIGYVRGDCAAATIGTGTGGGVASTGKVFIRLPATTELFTTQTRPTSGIVNASLGTVLQMVTTQTYTINSVTYCTLYFNNTSYNTLYDNVKAGILSDTELGVYVETLWNSALSTSLKRELGLVGDVRVYALQVALSKLGYYTGSLDGSFGGGTQSAVRNFQRKVKVTVDGACGAETWNALRTQLAGTSGNTGDGGTTGGIATGDFGTVNRVVQGSWSRDDDGASMFPKSSYATVMDVKTGKVFSIYRWSGGNHADCVPATAADTKVMCDVVNFPYNSSAPTSSQLSRIKADGDKDVVTYTWPDFKNSFGGATHIGSGWDRRAALLNVNGTVYPISIYGFPHGFEGDDSFSRSKFPGGKYFYEVNNYYGMMCIHFTNSTTHGGATPDKDHLNAINTAYAEAKKLWPTLVK